VPQAIQTIGDLTRTELIVSTLLASQPILVFRKSTDDPIFFMPSVMEFGIAFHMPSAQATNDSPTQHPNEEFINLSTMEGGTSEAGVELVDNCKMVLNKFEFWAYALR